MVKNPKVRCAYQTLEWVGHYLNQVRAMPNIQCPSISLSVALIQLMVFCLAKIRWVSLSSDLPQLMVFGTTW